MRLISLALATALILYSVPATRAYPNAPQNPTEFGNVNLLVPHKNTVKQTAVRLRLDADALIIEARPAGEVQKQFKYAEIKSAEYSHSKHPRWKEGIGASVVGVSAGGAALGSLALALSPLAAFVAVPIFLKTVRMKSKKHWLTIKTGDDFALLRLDKRNYRLLILAFETRAGIKVETVAEEK